MWALTATICSRNGPLRRLRAWVLLTGPCESVSAPRSAFFWIIRGGALLDISVAISLAMVGISALFAVLPAYVSSLFEAKVRYTGSSLAYGIGAGLVGGLTPLLASSLYLWSISSWPIALYLVGISVISIVVVIASPGSWTRSGTINHLFVAVTEK
jgi:hypothetical protein